jgi:hypothetical protein
VPRPTEPSAAVTSSNEPVAAITSTIGRSAGHCGPQKGAGSPKIKRPIEVLPEPDGPTTTPICQSPLRSSSASKEKSQPLSALNRDLTRAAR